MEVDTNLMFLQFLLQLTNIVVLEGQPLFKFARASLCPQGCPFGLEEKI